MSDHRYWTHRVTDYVDDDMTPADRIAFEAHLDGCAECDRTVEDVRAVVARAAELGPIEPPRDLWPAIERSLGDRARARGAETRVIALPTATAHPPREAPRRRAFTLSGPQLAAAAVVLTLFSVTATTLALRPGAGPDGRPALESGAVRAASDAGQAEPDGLAEDVAVLEDALDAAADRLDPNTVRIIEKNLAVIERAIEESRQALLVDPENAFLRSHLDRAFQRKRDYLQEATLIVEWAG